jgi:hypothetical protein
MHVTKIALALPDTTRLVHGSHAQFLVRNKTFAYFLNNHHGDGIVALACKVLPGDNQLLAAAQPDRFTFLLTSHPGAGSHFGSTGALSIGTKSGSCCRAAMC